MYQLTITGHLGKDAIQKEANGRRFLTFSVGVDDSFKEGDQRIERTAWVDVTTDHLVVAPYLLKGTKVLVQGRLKTDTWTDQEGNVRVQVRLRATLIELLSPKQTTASPPTAPAAEPKRAFADDDTNDLPF